MKNAFRAGLSLVGVAAVLLTPAVAAGQIDAGQAVGEAVGQVGDALSQAPVQVPAAPAQPASPPAAAPAPQAAPSVPAGPGPAPASAGGSSGASAGGSSGASGSGATSGGSAGSTRSAGTGKPAGRGGPKALAADGKARAAGNKSGGAAVVLAQTDTDELDPPEGESYSGAVTTSPDTGVAGDPELPFTGGPVLLLLAMGIVALAAGLALRTAARRRHAG
jgi:hypothetical protein